MYKSLMLNPEADTQVVNRYLTDWFAGNYDVEPNLPAQSSINLTWMTDLLRMSFQVHAIHNVAESLAKTGAGFYYISPEYPGPALWSLRPNDPMYTHYRNMHFFLRRASLYHESETVKNILRGYVCSAQDPNGGRHRVIADPDKFIYPSTPAIGTDFPKALGTALSIHLPKFLNYESSLIPGDAICVVCGGDGTSNHPTVLSTCNLVNYYIHEKKVPVPLLMVFTDNGIALSERSHRPLKTRLSHWGWPIYYANNCDPFDVFQKSQQAEQYVREKRQVAVLIIKTTRLFGHAANRRNEHFSEEELQTMYANNPLLYLMQAGLALGIWTREDCRIAHDKILYETLNIAETVMHERNLEKDMVAAPLVYRPQNYTANYNLPSREVTHAREAMSCMYRAIVENDKHVMILGQDQPGHYGVMLGIDKIAPKQISGFPIDEIGLGGLPNGLARNNILTITECPYKQFSVEGILSGGVEWTMQRFLCDKPPPKGRIIRSPFGISKGGPSHSENAFYELTLIPQAKVLCAGTPYSAALLIHLAYQMAKIDSQCVWINEPTRLYALRESDFPGNCHAIFNLPNEFDYKYNEVIGYTYDSDDSLKIFSESTCLQKISCYRYLIITFGNGVEMSLRAKHNLQLRDCLIIEVPCLKPTKVLRELCKEANAIIIAGETRPMGSPGSIIKCDLVDSFPEKASKIYLINSEDTFNPSGPALSLNYLSTSKIEAIVTLIFSSE